MIAPPQRITSPAPMRSKPPLCRHLDADCPRALEEDARHEHAAADLQVRTVGYGVQVRACRAPASPVANRAVEGPEPLLAIAVDVGRSLVAGLARRLEERPEELVRRRAAFEDERAAAAAVVVGARDARLHALEVGQAVRVAPALEPGLGRPLLVVERVAALEDHPVDRARPAEHLAAGMGDAAPVHERLRLGCVAPVVVRVPDRKRERRGHVDVRVPPGVGAPGLEHEHARSGIGAQPVGEHAAGGAPADDDVVVARHARSTLSRSSVETSATRSPPPVCRTPSSSMTVQKGQATASVRAPVSAASRARSSLI